MECELLNQEFFSFLGETFDELCLMHVCAKICHDL